MGILGELFQRVKYPPCQNERPEIRKRKISNIQNELESVCSVKKLPLAGMYNVPITKATTHLIDTIIEHVVNVTSRFDFYFRHFQNLPFDLRLLSGIKTIP
jgi:hypothetical protein